MDMKSVGKVLASGSKVAILQELSKGPMSFTELLETLNETSGNLNYHLLTLQNSQLAEKMADGKYALSPHGKEALTIMRQVAKL